MIPCSVNDLCACYAWSFGSIWDNFCKLSIFVAHMFHSTSQPFFFDHCGPSLRTIRKNCSMRSGLLTNFCFLWFFFWLRRWFGSSWHQFQRSLCQDHVLIRVSFIPNIRQWTRKCFGFRSGFFFCQAFTKKSNRFVLLDTRIVLENKDQRIKKDPQCFSKANLKKKRYKEEDVTTYQERFESYLRRGYNVSGTSCRLLDEDVTTYQEPFESYLKKRLQRIRNVLQVTWRRCYNVSGTFWKLLEEDATTYQERLASYLTKMLQRIRNVLKVTWRSCCNVAGNRYWQRRPQDAITPPTPPKKKQCAKVTTVTPLHVRRCPSPVGRPFLRPRTMYIYIYIFAFCCLFCGRFVTERVINARYHKKKEKERSTNACKHAVHSARDGQRARALS